MGDHKSSMLFLKSSIMKTKKPADKPKPTKKAKPVKVVNKDQYNMKFFRKLAPVEFF